MSEKSKDTVSPELAKQVEALAIDARATRQRLEQESLLAAKSPSKRVN